MRGWGQGLSSSSDSLSDHNLGESNDEDDDANNMAKKMSRGGKYPVTEKVEAGGGTRSGMLKIAADRVRDKEGKIRGRKTS